MGSIKGQKHNPYIDGKEAHVIDKLSLANYELKEENERIKTEMKEIYSMVIGDNGCNYCVTYVAPKIYKLLSGG